MPLSARSGWGIQTAFFPVTKSIAGPVNSVIGNVGVAVSVLAGSSPIRLTKLSWRVDLAPDVIAGSVNVPVRWRVMVLAGVIAQDISAYQAQQYANGSHPEIPALTSQITPNPTLHDVWLDFSVGDPGLNRLASEAWADAGPTVDAGDTMTAILIPILDANLGQSLLGAANAQCVISMNGCGFAAVAGAAGSSSGSSSLPRYAVRA